MTTQETSIAVKQETAISIETRPSFVAREIPMEKVKVPRLNLLQPGSDQVQIQGRPVGSYENVLTMENYGTDVALIPIKISYGAIYFKKKGTTDKIKGPTDQGLQCKSVDGVFNLEGKACRECPFGVYHREWKGSTPPSCSSTVDVLCLTSKNEPVVFTFKNTGHKAGEKLSSALKFIPTVKAFKLTSTFRKNDDGNFFVPAVTGFEDITDEQYKTAADFKSQAEAGKVDIQEEQGNDT